MFKNIFSGLNPQQKQLLVKEYGSIDIAVEEEAKRLATTIYNTTFGGKGEKVLFAEPYITAFCTIDKANERIANHGLLSQWRAYGAQGGYVIIFDTKQQIQLLHEEGKKWAYSAVFAGDVVYSSATDEEVYDEFREQIDAIQRNWENAFHTRDYTALKDTYKHIVSCACRYKHWGFEEEREFRIVAVPTPPEIVEIAKKDGKTISPKKPVSSFVRNSTAVPYLNLFDGITRFSDNPLPIKRVIVGPHPDKDKRKMAVEKLLSQNNIQPDVSVTAIPYLA